MLRRATAWSGTDAAIRTRTITAVHESDAFARLGGADAERLHATGRRWEKSRRRLFLDGTREAEPRHSFPRQHHPSSGRPPLSPSAARQLAAVIPAKGAQRPQSRDPIGPKIVERGPVLAPAHLRIVAQALDPAVPLNGSRLSLRSAGMTRRRRPATSDCPSETTPPAVIPAKGAQRPQSRDHWPQHRRARPGPRAGAPQDRLASLGPGRAAQRVPALAPLGRDDAGAASRHKRLPFGDNPARRHPGQGREAPAEPGPIGRSIVERGPVPVLAHLRIVSQAVTPAVPLNGSRLSLRSAGMTRGRRRATSDCSAVLPRYSRSIRNGISGASAGGMG